MLSSSSRSNRVAYPTIVISDKSVIPSARHVLFYSSTTAGPVLSGLSRHLAFAEVVHMCVLPAAAVDVAITTSVANLLFCILVPSFPSGGPVTREFGLRLECGCCPWGPARSPRQFKLVSFPRLADILEEVPQNSLVRMSYDKAANLLFCVHSVDVSCHGCASCSARLAQRSYVVPRLLCNVDEFLAETSILSKLVISSHI